MQTTIISLYKKGYSKRTLQRFYTLVENPSK